MAACSNRGSKLAIRAFTVTTTNEIQNITCAITTGQKPGLIPRFKNIAKSEAPRTTSGVAIVKKISVFVVKEWQLDGMKEEAALRNQYGDHVEVLSQSEVQARVNSPIYKGALWDADGTALVDPARLVWGLEKVCLKLGVKIYENSKVEWLERTSDGIIVHTPYGSVYSDKVALATNVFKSLIKRARKYVVPVYDFQLVTEPLTPEQWKAIGWSGKEGLSEAGNQFHYYRVTSEGAILWGGYDAIYHFRGKARQEYETDAETYAYLAADFLETFPQLKGIKFTHGWGGAIDTCSRFAPFWGRAYRKRVAYVLGFTGLGVPWPSRAPNCESPVSA